MESLDYELDDEDEEGSTGSGKMSKSKSKAREHKEQLQRLQEKVGRFTLSCDDHCLVRYTSVFAGIFHHLLLLIFWSQFSHRPILLFTLHNDD